MQSLVMIQYLLLVLATKLRDGDASPLREKFVVHSSEWSPREGQTLTLSCFIDGPPQSSIPSPSSYEWVKDGKVILGQTGQTLTIEKLSVQDEGDYQCGPPGSDFPRDVFHLDVILAPKIAIKPTTPDSAVKGILGDSLTLTCEVTNALPRVPADGYTWSFLPSLQGTLRSLASKTKTLTLNPLQKEHSGQYTCQARNDQRFRAGTVIGKASVMVEVVYLENIRMPPVVEVDTGEWVALTCRVDSHPEANLTWFMGRHEVRRVVDNADHFVIPNVACADSMNYTCRASNADMPGRELFATTELRVPCTNDYQNQTQFNITWGHVSAQFNFSLPEQTSMVVVHPSGEDIITIYKNCSYDIFAKYVYRCLNPHCDFAQRHFFFTLSKITKRDEGNYVCMEVGHQRKAIPDCQHRLILARHMMDLTSSGTSVWLIIAAFTAVVWVATGAVLIILQRRRILQFFNRLKHNAWKELFTRAEREKGSHAFENLYDQGKVYVIPQLVPPEQEDVAVMEEEANESTCLLHTSEKADFTVKNLVKYTLQKLTGDDSLPSFFLHNTCLSWEENIVLVLNRNLGVILMVIIPVKEVAQLYSIQKALNHLLEARKVVQKRLVGLVNSSKITAAIALPHLPQTGIDGLRKFLKQNVEVLLGQEPEDFLHWAQGLSKRPDSAIWNLSTSGLDNTDTVFKMAASKFLTLAGSKHPQETSKRPTVAESWLLTPAQMEVRDSTEKLLHVWGSPGSGKTTLLIHRARQWLAEGKTIVLAVGREVYDVLLAYVIREVLREQSDQIRKKIRVCRMHSKLQLTLKELRAQYPKNDICLVIDTLRDAELFRNTIEAIQSKQVSALWSVCRDSLETIHKDLSKEAHKLGWESLKLPDSIRCTKNTVELLNKLGKGSDIHYPISALSVPRDQDISEWTVVDHCFHPTHTPTPLSCDHCKSKLSPSLTFPDQDPRWSNWLALFTGNPNVVTDIKPICNTLQDYGIPATLDSHYEIVASHGAHLDSSETDMTKWLERVVAGEDESGRPTVHLVPVRDLAGMEKEGVLLVHWDERDVDPKCQSPEDRQTRLKEHRYLWILAVSRSKSQVILLLLTPSPARSLLDLPEPVMPTNWG